MIPLRPPFIFKTTLNVVGVVNWFVNDIAGILEFADNVCVANKVLAELNADVPLNMELVFTSKLSHSKSVTFKTGAVIVSPDITTPPPVSKVIIPFMLLSIV